MLWQEVTESWYICDSVTVIHAQTVVLVSDRSYGVEVSGF